MSKLETAEWRSETIHITMTLHIILYSIFGCFFFVPSCLFYPFLYYNFCEYIILFSFLNGYLVFEFQQLSSSNHLYRSESFTGEKEIPISGTQPIRVIDFAKRKFLIGFDCVLMAYFISIKTEKTIAHVSLVFIHSFFTILITEIYKIKLRTKIKFFFYTFITYICNQKYIFENNYNYEL